MPSHHPILIIGGGSAGITVAALLRQRPDAPAVTIVEPSDKHWYQPIWTLVGAGVFDKASSQRDEARLIPPGVGWIRSRVRSIEPDRNQVTLDDGETLTHDQLVVAAGIQLDWGRIEGLKETLGKNGVTSNYSYDTVDYTWTLLSGFKGGRALFTYPSTLIKCAGAPQKIMWLAEHHFQRTGIRKGCEVVFASAGAGIFGVERYARPLRQLLVERDVKTLFKQDLVKVDGPAKKAWFKDMETGALTEQSFDLLHVTPHQSAPDFLKQGPLADAAGWVEVDMYSGQHTRFPNVFSLGDCSSMPNSKTAAAIRKQAPVIASNLLDQRAGRPLGLRYDGYASCPLVTGYGRLILAEFRYGGVPDETLPVEQDQERWSTWATKAYALPALYWHGMLKGRW